MEPNKPLITISGPPASGTSSVAEELADQLNFEIVSGGDIFRKMADEYGLTLAELTRKCEADESIDQEVDERLKELIVRHAEGERETEKDGLIVESRLAGWHAEEYATTKVHLTAPRDVRISRIDDRDETIDELKEREQSEISRWKEFYGVDITDSSIYDLNIDTSNNSVEQAVNKITQEVTNQITQ